MRVFKALVFLIVVAARGISVARSSKLVQGNLIYHLKRNFYS